MTPAETYHFKRQNFVEKVKKYFEYLVVEFGYDTPVHTIKKLSSGTIIQDKIEFKKKDKTLSFVNAYHPVDYGFEINLTLSHNAEAELIHAVLKEKQDLEQEYLKSASSFLRNTYKTKIK